MASEVVELSGDSHDCVPDMEKHDQGYAVEEVVSNVELGIDFDVEYDHPESGSGDEDPDPDLSRRRKRHVLLPFSRGF